MTNSACSVGPANQTQIRPTVHNIASTIPPNGVINSNLIQASGYTKIAAGITSSQNGVLTIQRYLDPNGNVLVGSPATLALVAGVPNSITVADGQMFGSFEIIIANASSSTALLADIGVAVSSDPLSPIGPGTASYTTLTSTSVTVAPTTGGTVLFGSNPAARYRSIRNLTANTERIWVAFGINPQVGGGFIDLRPGDLYEMSVAGGNLYQGTVTAISENIDQPILVSEGV